MTEREAMTIGNRFPARRVDATSTNELHVSDFEGDGDMRYGDSPEENVHDNTRRAGFVISALRAYSQKTGMSGEDFETTISDMLGDMRHLCDALDVDFDAASERGGGHYEAEVTGNWA
jgi:hypothetical protein